MDRKQAMKPGSLVWLLAHAGFLARRRLEVQLEADSLSPPEAMLLRRLVEQGAQPVLELARHAGFKGSTVVGMLDRLEERGFLVRSRSKEDRRVVMVDATPQGRKEVTALKRLVVQVERELAAALSPSQKKSLRSLLVDLLEGLWLRRPELMVQAREEQVALMQKRRVPRRKRG